MDNRVLTSRSQYCMLGVILTSSMTMTTKSFTVAGHLLVVYCHVRVHLFPQG